MGKSVGEQLTQEGGEGGWSVSGGNELPGYAACIPEELITVVLQTLQ
jgi:hypothetical protein